MKRIVTLTEDDLTRIVIRIIKEQKIIDYVLNPKLTLDSLVKHNSEVIKNNQKFLNKTYNLKLPVDGKVSEEYTKYLNIHLDRLKVSKNLMEIVGVATNFIPIYETYLDFKSIFNGIVNGDKEQLYGGIAALSSNSVSYKALIDILDYVNDELMGETESNNMAKKRNDVLNMSDYELQLLYKNYGLGGYDKWVKDGRPELK